MRKVLMFISILLAACANNPQPTATTTGVPNPTHSPVWIPLTECAKALANDPPPLFENTGLDHCEGYLKILKPGEALSFSWDGVVVDNFKLSAMMDGYVYLQDSFGANRKYHPYDPVMINSVTVAYVIAYSEAWDAVILYVPNIGYGAKHTISSQQLPADDFLNNVDSLEKNPGRMSGLPNGACVSATLRNGREGRVTVSRVDAAHGTVLFDGQINPSKVGGLVYITDVNGSSEAMGLIVGVKENLAIVFWFNGGVVLPCSTMRKA